MKFHDQERRLLRIGVEVQAAGEGCAVAGVFFEASGEVDLRSRLNLAVANTVGSLKKCSGALFALTVMALSRIDEL